MPHKNTRKPLVFWIFLGVWEIRSEIDYLSANLKCCYSNLREQNLAEN